jgi:hypothetical protein
MIWDVFISHASEDTKSVAEPLAQALSRAGVLVWFDQFQLTLGDRLFDSLNEGLKQCRFGVVVLSPPFFNKRWTRDELNAFANREVNGRKVILPVWKDVTRDEVCAWSPLLADRIAAQWSGGLESVVEQILRVVQVSDAADDENIILGAILRISQRTRFLWPELTKHLTSSTSFTARIHADTLATIKEDLASLHEQAGLIYDVRHVGYDADPRVEINEITIKRMTPALSKAIIKALALYRLDPGTSSRTARGRSPGPSIDR